MSALCLQIARRWELPSDAATVVRYISRSKATCSPATIRRWIAAIGRVHRLMDFGDPTKSQPVILELRRMNREKGRRQKQAVGMTADIRDALIDAAGDDLAGLRDRLVVSLAYDTLRRRSELVRLRLEDITPVPQGGAVVLVTHSKTDQEGEGRFAYISPRTMDFIAVWLDRTNIQSGPVLRALRRGGKPRDELSGDSVSRIFKRLAARAGLPQTIVSGLSGHSARVGAAQDMAAAGIDIIAIMQAGGWKSPNVVGRYVENLDVLRGGSFRLAMQQQQRR